MRFNNNAALEKFKKRQQWHSWFAWHAVRTISNDVVWLFFLERKGIASIDQNGKITWKWSYRFPPER